MKLVFIICFLFQLTACTKPAAVENCTDITGLYQNAPFAIGVAIQVNELLSNPQYRNIAQKQFNSVTPENAFKADRLHPQENTFNWVFADTLVKFCEENNKRIHGHTLVWHSQLPQWILNYQGDYTDWENVLEKHIKTIVTHFKGKVKSWDVVNEAFNEDGTLRNSIWRQKLGDSYIEKAFRYAHEADPDALLFYNDYGLEYNPNKRKATIRLFNNLRKRGVKIDGIGLQTHISIQYPASSQIADALQDIAANNYKVHISEMDISINPNNKDIGSKEKNFEQQAHKLGEIVLHYKQLPKHLQYGITFWGISDANTWIRSFYNREDYPLLYDDNYTAKPMYCQLKAVL